MNPFEQINLQKSVDYIHFTLFASVKTLYLFQLLEERGIEWARRNEDLQRELRQALRSSICDTEREAASVNTLEQVILKWT